MSEAAKDSRLVASSLADAAQAMALQGIPLFPCDQNKHPLTEHGFKDASTESDQVKNWWRRHPQANIGIPTGARSGYDVLDFDSMESLAEVERRFGPLKTFQVRTPRGGAHFYFSHDPERPFPTKTDVLKTLGIPKVDARGNGGYVLAPQSRTDKGEYRVEVEIPLAPVPDWLWDVFKPKSAAPVAAGMDNMARSGDDASGLAQRCLESALAKTSDGSGDALGFDLACQLRDNRITDGLALKALEDYARLATRNPSQPFTEKDAKRWWTSANTKAPRESWGDGGERDAEFNAAPAGAPSIVELSAPRAPDLFQPFPLHLLPRTLAEWIGRRAKAIPCDPSMIALPVLAMLAAAVGATRRIQLNDIWSEPSVLWTAIIAQSGSAKSPAIDAALELLQAIERRADREYRRAYASWHEEVNEWKQAPKGERAPSPPAPPKPRRYIVSDATIEAVAPLLLDNPRGLLNYRDELAGWIEAMGAYKGGRGRGDDLAKWLEMHGARPLRVDRKASEQRFLYVPRAAVSVTGGVQPGILRRLIGDQEKESGFLARLLLACPPEMPKRWTDGEADERGGDRIRAIVERLLELDFERGEDSEEKPIDLHLAPDARAPFAEWVNTLGEEMVGMGDALFRAALAKLEGGAARLGLVLHLAELADQGGPMNAPVSRMAIERGIGLARWFSDETRRVYRILSETDEERVVRQVAEVVVRLGGRATARDLARSMRRYRSEGGMEQAEVMLRRLAAAGLGEWRERERGDQGGRPTFELVLAGARRHNPEDSEGFSSSVTVAIEEREVIEL